MKSALFPASQRSSRTAAFLFVSFACAACSAGGGKSGGSNQACRVGSECASGACGADGFCVAVPDVTDAPLSTDTGSLHDTGGGATDSATSSETSGGCTGNNDFVIDPTELPLGPGLRGTFRVGTNTAIDTAGKAQPDGSRVWDYTGAMSNDANVLVETLSPTGAWWASAFGAASYAVTLSTSANLQGVFKIDASGLSLLGIVSPSDGLTKTELSYATPVPFVKLPLKLGDTWTDTSNVTGPANGVTSFYTESYDVKVDAKGQLSTPFGKFSVLRVQTVLTRTVGALPTVTRTYGFIAECFGTVASITSNPNESATEFTTAAEARRLIP